MISNSKTIFAIATWLAGCALAPLASATPIILTVGAGGTPGDLILGEAIPAPSASSGAGGLLIRDALVVDTLRLMTPGARTVIGTNPEYYRSTTLFPTLPATVQAGAIYGTSTNSNYSTWKVNGTTSIEITLPIDMTFQYLVGAWDGPNGGAEVWYIGDVAAGSTLAIPYSARPDPESTGSPKGAANWPQNLVNGNGDSYGYTSWSMFNPTTVTVPEGTSVVVLLGLAFLGMTLFSRHK